MTEGSKRRSLTPIILGVLLVAALGAALYFGYQTYTLSHTVATMLVKQNSLEQQLLSLDDQRRAEQEDAQQTITNLTEELEDLEDDYRRERDRNEDFEDQLDELAGTVGTLDKLSKTDEELLQKYSRVYFLNENFVPSDLDQINDRYVHDSKDDEYFHGDAMPFLEELMREARRDGIDIEIVSAYRSFDEQREVKAAHTVVYGEGANTFSADQGYSEHQLGTAVDFGTSELGNAVNAFGQTEAYEWLLDNAYKYGFVLSYPEGNQFYIFEPWHWRFVGTDLARDLHRADASFYDWEQRKIDEYLVEIFD